MNLRIEMNPVQDLIATNQQQIVGLPLQHRQVIASRELDKLRRVLDRANPRDEIKLTGHRRGLYRPARVVSLYAPAAGRRRSDSVFSTGCSNSVTTSVG